ncbi:Hypp7940 [Branchiostoma lanceolatum]|uniref:Hypp7940 protein n=1 Tax=Branchiostoma lanceolatum TaxID=7740 RepID=A0A8J9Z4F7_BRALA|nr:Hypp7940 [Branchiostoma lanceolatum]
MQPKVFEDDDVTMTCSTDDLGNPPGNFTGQQFPKTAGTQKSTSLLLQATREHNGEVIVCEFQYRHFNQTRKNTTKAQLTIFYLPETVSIKARDSVTRFNVGDNVTLQCIVGRSNPNSTISWWKDNVILQGETSAIFVRNSVNVRDGGKYKCKATIQALGQSKFKASKEVDVNVTSPGPAHVTPSSKRATKSLLTTVDLVIIGSAAVVVMVIIIVVTVLLCFWKRQDNRTQTPHHQANGSFHLVSSRPRDDVIAFGSHQGDLDVEEPQPPPYSRVDPDRRFPTTQTCPWADGACLLPLTAHHAPSPVHVPTASFPDGTTPQAVIPLVAHHAPSPVHVPTASFPDGTTPQATVSVPSVTQETSPKVTTTADEIEEDSSIPDKPGSLRSQPPPLPTNLDINTMISSCDSDTAS